MLVHVRASAPYLGVTIGVPLCGKVRFILNPPPQRNTLNPPKRYKRLKKREKRVNRAYGGSRCAHCARGRSRVMHFGIM